MSSKVFRQILILFAVAFIMGGCASHHAKRVIQKGDNFILVSKTSRDTYESLAEEFLGGKAYASVIARYNPALAANRYVAIPTRSFNATAVYVDGYMQVPVLCYHQFTRKDRSSNRMVVTEKEFSEQMDYLKDNGYQVITLDALYRFIRGEREIPEKSVVITIDDGYRSYLDIAVPILRERQFPSTMFVYPEFIEAGLALGWKDLMAFSDDPLVDIQSHSKTHDNLARKGQSEPLPEYMNRLEQEVLVAEQRLERKLGKGSIRFFAYPYGSTSTELIDLLEESQYQLGLTVERGSTDAFADPYLISRTMIFGGDSLSKFKRALNTFKRIDLK